MILNADLKKFIFHLKLIRTGFVSVVWWPLSTSKLLNCSFSQVMQFLGKLWWKYKMKLESKITLTTGTIFQNERRSDKRWGKPQINCWHSNTTCLNNSSSWVEAVANFHNQQQRQVTATGISFYIFEALF